MSSAADPRCDRLAELSESAFRMARAFSAEAERAGSDIERMVRFYELFDRCFFGVRMAAALQMRLERQSPVRAARPDRLDRLDVEREETLEVLDEDRPGGDLPRERDRDRETEPASFPLLLRTLEGVTADAGALPGPRVDGLGALRSLLRVPSGPGPTPNLRARLSGSGAPTPPPLRSPAQQAARRATGPPFRKAP